eukprot:scaffold112455_cov20-Cyclotella_meneghiniana.AAC.1
MYFTSEVIKKVVVPIGSDLTFPPASSVASNVSDKPEKNKKNIETDDGVLNSEGSDLTPNDASEKEKTKSEGNSGSLNNSIIDDSEFTDPFPIPNRGSALALKEVLKDETKEIVKSAVKVDKTGNVGLDFYEGADAKLNDSKTEVAISAKTAFGVHYSSTGNVGLVFYERLDATLKNAETEINETVFELHVTSGNGGLEFDEGTYAMLKDAAMEKFGGNVAEDFVVNAITDPPISDGIISMKFDDDVAANAFLKIEKAGAFGVTAEKGDG